MITEALGTRQKAPGLPPQSQTDGHIQKLYGDMMDREFSRVADLTIHDFRPAPGTVVVKKAPPVTETKGGLTLPERAWSEQSIGVIVAVSDAETRYRVGELVLFRGGDNTRLPLDDQEYLILQNCGGIDDGILGSFGMGKEAKQTA